ncbi:MAG: hypothetical protein JG772_1054, partial [Dysgonamonadaceae bacterium]|nr:hypothetical protein [Dysgonamonadaceae bacterium]
MENNRAREGSKRSCNCRFKDKS